MPYIIQLMILIRHLVRFLKHWWKVLWVKSPRCFWTPPPPPVATVMTRGDTGCHKNINIIPKAYIIAVQTHTTMLRTVLLLLLQLWHLNYMKMDEIFCEAERTWCYNGIILWHVSYDHKHQDIPNLFILNTHLNIQSASASRDLVWIYRVSQKKGVRKILHDIVLHNVLIIKCNYLLFT